MGKSDNKKLKKALKSLSISQLNRLYNLNLPLNSTQAKDTAINSILKGSNIRVKGDEVSYKKGNLSIYRDSKKNESGIRYNRPLGKANGGLTNYAHGGKMDIKQQTQNVANQGRYGDSMLMHVNPAEVRGLASAMPLTTNPQTGQPEAFLPFLAPLLGSLAGSTLLTGSTLGGLAASGLSSAVASGIGAGLAQTAVTGDIKEGLLTGLMAGASTSILGGAGAEQISADTLAQATPEISQMHTKDLLSNSALREAGAVPLSSPSVNTGWTNLASNAPPAGGSFSPTSTGTSIEGIANSLNNPVLNLKGEIALSDLMAGSQNRLTEIGGKAGADWLANDPSIIDSGRAAFSEGIGQGVRNIGTAAMNDPLALATLGTSGTVLGMDQMQADYERQVARREAEAEERKRQIDLTHPEPILYSAQGGRTGYISGGELGLPDSITGGGLPQVFAPKRQAYQVNPNFKAGFAPETMYFNPSTLNAPASRLVPSAWTAANPAIETGTPSTTDTYTGTKGGYDYEGSYDAEGNYVAGTAQGVQFAPQTAIDPYAAYSGSAPLGLVQSEYNPYPVTPKTLPSDKDSKDSTDGDGGFDFSGYNPEDWKNMQLFGTPSNNTDFSNIDFSNIDPAILASISNSMPQNVDWSGFNPESFSNNNLFPNEENVSSSGTAFLEGGNTSGVPINETVQTETIANISDDPLVKEVTMFILGESNNEEAVNMFLTKYGNEAFIELRQMVLQSISPNAQTEGQIAGVNNGGMDDDINGTIGGKEKIAVSQDEFIVPADVVSMLGDGSSDAGSKELYDMMDRIRQKKTGTTKQAPKLANAGGLLPA